MHVVVNGFIMAWWAHIRFVEDADMRPLLPRLIPPDDSVDVRGGSGKSTQVVKRTPVREVQAEVATVGTGIFETWGLAKHYSGVSNEC